MTKEKLKELGITVDEGKEYTEDELFDLISQHQQSINADLKKHRDLLSARNSEIANYKKKEQEKLSEEEKTRLHYEELEKQNAEYKRTINRTNKVNEYMGIGYSKELAEKVADAELDGKSTVEYRKQFITAREETLKAELLKQVNPPKTNDPNPAKLTKEDYIKGGYEAMEKLAIENPQKYEELFGKKIN